MEFECKRVKPLLRLKSERGRLLLGSGLGNGSRLGRLVAERLGYAVVRALALTVDSALPNRAIASERAPRISLHCCQLDRADPFTRNKRRCAAAILRVRQVFCLCFYTYFL